MLFIRNGGQFAVSRELALHAGGDIFTEMLTDVVGDQLDASVRLIDVSFLCKLFLEICLLPLSQSLGDVLEPNIYDLCIGLQLGDTLFVQQRGNHGVLYGALHGVGMDDGSEDIGRLLGFEQRRTSEGNIRRIGQGLAHTLMRFPTVAPVALIYQNNEVGTQILTLGLPGCGRKLVDNREQDAFSTLANTPSQVSARVGPGLLNLTFGGQRPGIYKNLAQLVFQVDTIGDNYEATGFQRVVQEQGLGQQDHGKRLAGTGRVPDHPPCPDAVPVLAIHPLNESFHTEELLITGYDLTVFLIEQDKETHEFQQPVGAQQADKQPVLPVWQQRALLLLLLEVVTYRLRSMAEQ